jgi:Ser/Thr protein kinase RdoA (MazF antagonist)
MVNSMPQTFPVSTSTLSPRALIEQVLPGYFLGEIAGCSFYSGGFNDTYRLRTVSGTVYFLRAYRRSWRTLPDIRYELDVLNHLHRKGFPAAHPLPYRDGEYYCAVLAPEGTRYVAVFTEAPGPEISYKTDPGAVSLGYGRAVARMHRALEDFSSAHKRFRMDLDTLIDASLRNIEPFLAHRPADWERLRRIALAVRERITGLSEAGLTRGVCHGDTQGYHANVSPDGTLTFYDFDCGGYGYPAYDLGIFLWCARLQEQVGERWEPFLEGYREVRPLPAPDEQAIPCFVLARYIWHMGVHTQNAPDWGCGWLNDEYFDERLKTLQEAEKEYLVER